MPPATSAPATSASASDAPLTNGRFRPAEPATRAPDGEAPEVEPAPASDGTATNEPTSSGRWRPHLSLRWRLVIGGLVAIALTIVVAESGWIGLRQASEAGDAVGRISTAQRYHQDADMMHDALRSDVFYALYATEEEDDDLAEETIDSVETHAERMRADQQQVQAVPLDPELSQAFEENRSVLLAYTQQAEELVQLAYGDRSAALAGVDRFEARFDELAASQASLTERLSMAADEAAAFADQQERAARRRILLASAAVLICLAGLTLGLNRMGRNLTGLLTRLHDDAKRRRLDAQLTDALEMADTEPDAHAVVERAMDAVAPGRPTELLLADSSVAHLTRAAGSPSGGAPGCPVESPWGCVAVRRGSAVTFESSEALNACPKLRGRESGSLSAACVPVSFMGHALGVLHATGPDGQPPSTEEVERLTALAGQAGNRIGTVRAFARTELQASTDGLTGLPNRRTAEERVRELVQQQRPFALALGDLDHFKNLNDTYGHDAGDRGLRVFARPMKATLRHEDLVARIGGEEFVVILPDADFAHAVDALERHREALSKAVGDGGVCPAFTVSFGLSDSRSGASLEDLMRVADRALYRAKELGRDRIVVAGDQVSA